MDINAQMDYSSMMHRIQKQLRQKDAVELNNIIDDISKYDIFDFLAHLSALSLVLENQNKSTILDAVITGILSRDRTSYPSNIKMSSGKFRSIIGRLENLHLKNMVDPAENPFIDRIRYYGNCWVFPGINYYPVFILQTFIDVICFQKTELNIEFTNSAQKLLTAVLTISDQIVQKLNLNLESLLHSEVANIVIPNANKYDELVNCVIFDGKTITHYFGDDSCSSIYSDFSSKNLANKMKNYSHDFFASPFLKSKDGQVILLNPSILASFAVHQIILLADRYGIKGALINSFNDHAWSCCKRDLYTLGHHKVSERSYEIDLINNQRWKEGIYTVGTDKLLFVFFVCDDGNNYHSGSMNEAYTSQDDIPDVAARISYFQKQLPLANSNSVFSVVIMHTLGREISVRISPQIRKTLVVLAPSEMHYIAVNEKHDGTFLAKYINAKKQLNCDVNEVKISELNSIEIYRSNNYSFYVSDDIDTSSINMIIPPGDSLDYILRAIKSEDRQLIESYDGVHLREVVLEDPIRHIYVTDRYSGQLPELALIFPNVIIWISFSKIEGENEISILSSIADAVSFWLAEAHTIVEKMKFPFPVLNICIDLLSPPEQYYTHENHPVSDNAVQYQIKSNKIIMQWTADAYRFLDNEFNFSERDVICSLMLEMQKMSYISIDSADISPIFSNPLKKKFISLDLSHSPMLTPTNAVPHVVSEVEINNLLDEIGNYFLSQGKYTYGLVPDEQKATLTNEVVGYLYSCLVKETAAVDSRQLLDSICFDLETLLQNIMITQKRFAYNIACYPEKAETFLEQQNDMNRASIALKFLAEYVAAIPSNSTKLLGTIQYDRLIAICSLIIEWAYRNDLFVHEIINSPIRFLKSGRIGMNPKQTDRLNAINLRARRGHLDNLSDPRKETYVPSVFEGVLGTQIDEAFVDEYGFSFHDFTKCVVAITDIGDAISGEVKCGEKEKIIVEICENTGIHIDKVRAIINQIVLTERNEYLIPPKPFDKKDVYPWRFNRELSFVRRPIILYGSNLIWGNRQLHHMLSYTIDLIVSGKYKARKPKLKKLLGQLSNKRGNEFNDLVAQKISSFGGVILRKKLSKINGKRISDSQKNDLGDIDVFIVIPESKKIIVGEVKDFSFARNPYEMAQEYRRIFIDAEKPCYLTRHKRRATWVEDHLQDVIEEFHLPKAKWKVKVAMFTSEEIISNKAFHEKETIIPYSEISEKRIKAI